MMKMQRERGEEAVCLGAPGRRCEGATEEESCEEALRGVCE